MAHLTVEINDKIISIKSQAFCCEFPDNDENQKALFVFLRSLCCPETGKALFTNQQVADGFGKNDRRDIDNFVRIFKNRGGDFLRYLERQATKKEHSSPEIERQILESPLLSIAEQYRMFCEEHPQQKVCEYTFRSYVNLIPVPKILKRVRQLGFKKEQSFDVKCYGKELLALDKLSGAKKKEIVAQFPAVEAAVACRPGKTGEGFRSASVSSKLLAVILYVCGLSQDMLALLFGVSKTSIHNWLYEVCTEELDWEMIRNIAQWSGQVSVDEKWVKITGAWHFVLCAVDSVSGFPLLMEFYPALNADNWTLFFKRFNALCGTPKQIQSDGSQPLATARAVAFSNVRYQLCKLHKLKNLMKRLRLYVEDAKLFGRCVRLAKHIFTNKAVSSRKHAAKRLQELGGEQVRSYIAESILTAWRNLTMSLTNNASERFNRKIEKCFSGRYGIPSVESAHVLLRGLWLKELLLNGHKHMAFSSELRTLNLSRMCQEHLDTNKILHFFHDNDPSRIEKVA